MNGKNTVKAVSVQELLKDVPKEKEIIIAIPMDANELLIERMKKAVEKDLENCQVVIIPNIDSACREWMTPLELPIVPEIQFATEFYHRELNDVYPLKKTYSAAQLNFLNRRKVRCKEKASKKKRKRISSRSKCFNRNKRG